MNYEIKGLEPPFLSVIIPVYNTGLYLRRCLDSLLSYESYWFELVVVNDGSTDDSGDILEEYAMRDRRVRFVHKSNGGLSSARNVGLELSLGVYVGFIDSDDYVDPNYFNSFINIKRRHEPDIIIGGRSSDIDGNVKPEFNLLAGFLTGTEAVERALLWDNLDCSVCDKIFKRVLFSGVRFQLGVYSEDVPVTFVLFQKAESIFHSGQVVYYYVKRKGSITTNFFSDKMISVLYSLEQVQKTLKVKMLDSQKIQFFFIWHYCRFIGRYFNLNKENQSLLKQHVSRYTINLGLMDIWCNKFLFKKDKLLITLLKLLS